MKHEEAVNFVIANARYSDDAAPQFSYSVRYPRRYSNVVFFGKDTDDLVKQVLKYGDTKKGKDLWEANEGKYLDNVFVDENEDEE